MNLIFKSCRDVKCPSCYASFPVSLFKQHLNQRDCYLSKICYPNPKGITMYEHSCEWWDGGNVYKWKPFVLKFDGGLCFVCCFLHKGIIVDWMHYVINYLLLLLFSKKPLFTPPF